MSQFSNNEWFEVEHCYKCGVAFGMTVDFQRRRLKDRKSFYCPSGHSQVYVGKTEQQKLKEKLASAERKAAKLEAEKWQAKDEAERESKKYGRLRERVKNGVCPCCNRTFQNLARHMKTKHPEWGTLKGLKPLRISFGLTQKDLAEEIGVSPTHVSMLENDKHVTEWVERSVVRWIERQAN